MPIVEMRIDPAQLPARMDEVREWLRKRACAHKIASTGSSDERVVIFDFVSEADADAFVRQFNGSVVTG